jgi:hypothetical protein
MWCTIINYGVLLVWFITALLHWTWPYDVTARLLGISREKSRSVCLGGFVFYKLAILFFNLVPFIVLYIVFPS